MSPQLLALLQSVARETRRHVAADNVNGPRHGRMTAVTDFYRPAELVHRSARAFRSVRGPRH